MGSSGINKSPADARKKVMPHAEKYLKSTKQSFATSICRLQEDSETALFKSMFSQFDAPAVKNWTPMSHIAQRRNSEINFSALHQQQANIPAVASRNVNDQKIT